MKTKQMQTADRLLYYATTRLLSLLGRFPLPLRRFWANLLGGFVFSVDRKHKGIVVDNLTRSLGEQYTERELYSIARRVFKNLVLILFEFGWSLRLSKNDFDKHFTIHGLDTYQKAMAKGKGVLALTAHFGNWELLSVIGHMASAAVHIVYRPLDTPFLDRIFKESRTRFGGRPIATRRGAMRHIYKALKRGYPVLMLMDQNVDWYEGAFVDFFNHRACTNTGMAMLALKSDAPVVPVFVIRGQHKFHTVIGPALETIRTGDRTKDVELNTLMYNRVIECFVRRFPDQWFWVHQRWKTRPHCPWPRQ